MRPEHIRAETYHKRLGGPDNAFRYPVDYVLIDAEARGPWPWLFGRNRRGLVALNDADHGGARGRGTGPAWVREVLAQYGIGPDEGLEILLLAQPRMLGLWFTPVSFWFIRRAGALIAVIAEVNNTFGDRHSYLCAHPDLRPIQPTDRLSAQKVMHVSPFQPVAGDYTFTFDLSEDALRIRIDYRNAEGGLIATLAGPRRAMSTGGLLAAMLRRPVGAARVLALIHAQALKLWWKGAPFRSRPEPPATPVSR